MSKFSEEILEHPSLGSMYMLAVRTRDGILIKRESGSDDLNGGVGNRRPSSASIGSLDDPAEGEISGVPKVSLDFLMWSMSQQLG